MTAPGLVAGFGFRAAAPTASLRDALARAAAGRSLDAVAALATVADKAASPALAALADELGVPVLAIPAAVLAAAPTVTQSAPAQRARGTGSVAEAAALSGAGGARARLIGARAVSADRMACCALAEREVP